MNKQTQDAVNKFTNAMTDACIVTNVLLMCLSVTLGDWILFKVAALSGCVLVVSRVYRYHEQKEKQQE